MCSVDLEPCDVWNEKEVRARKQHTCDCCGATVNPGQKYIAHSSLFEGSWTSEKQCLPCFEMSNRFALSHQMKSTPSSMRILLEECVDYEGADEADEWVRALSAMDERRAAA